MEIGWHTPSPELMIDPVELVDPCTGVRESFLRALLEYQAEGRYLDLDREVLEGNFEAYLRELVAQADPATPRPPGRVPETTLWYVAGSEFLGRIAIRHRLTTKLRQFGGHIGYDVVPTARGKGHATCMLGLALPVARKLGIDRALLTCDRDNIASRKVIEANGGIVDDDATERLRFWIAT